MGQANRRKQADPSWGKPIIPQFVIETSDLTSKQLIVLKYKDKSRTISPHVSEEGLNFGFSQCQKCLEAINAQKWGRNFEETFQEFLRLLNEKFSYPDDDEVIGVIQDGQLDVSIDARNQFMAEVNIDSIHEHGERFWTHPPTPFEDSESD